METTELLRSLTRGNFCAWLTQVCETYGFRKGKERMDYNTLQTAISQLGFPIVMVIAMAYFIWKLWEKSQQQNENREEKLYSVISKAQEQNEKLSATNAEFVQVLTSYKDDLDDIREDVSEIKTQINK